MAILNTIPGVNVTIRVNGVDLIEFAEPDIEDEPKVLTRYIEAVSDANFAVALKLTPEFQFMGDCVTFYISVDGVLVIAPMLRADKRQGIREGISISTKDGTKLRRFKFSLVETACGHDEDGHKMIGNLGKIKIEVYHQQTTGPATGCIQGKAIGGPRVLSEKALKGETISHSTSLGDPEDTVAREYYSTVNVGRQGPDGTFVFKYRSKSALQSMLIIPRSPSPIPLEERAEEELSLNEARELLRRFKAKHTTEIKSEVKREHEDDDDESPRPRKTVRPGRRVTNLELDDDGNFRESSTPVPQQEIEVIELE